MDSTFDIPIYELVTITHQKAGLLFVIRLLNFILRTTQNFDYLLLPSFLSFEVILKTDPKRTRKMDYYCLIQVRLEGRDIPVDVGYSQGTSVQAVLERACKTLNIYDSWNHALYSELFKTWLCESHLLSSYPAEDTLIVRKKTPEYLELVYNEENPKKRTVPLTTNTTVQTKRRGVFSSTKTSLKTRFHPETIYLSAILFTSDSKILITSGTKMFPTIEVIKDSKIFTNFEDDSEEFAHVIRTSLDWATSTEFDHKDDDTDSLHSSHSNNTGGDPSSDNNSSQFYGDQDTLWTRSFGQAALKLKSELSLESLGALYEHVVQMNTSKSKFIVALQHVPNCIKDEIAPDLIKSGILKWKNFDEISSVYQKDPHPVWSNFIEKWCSRQTKLSPGLYLGVLYTESTLQGIKILVPKDRKQFIPLGKIRDEATITPEEASWIKSLTCLSQDCFMDLAMATRSDHDNNKSSLGQFQTSFLDCYHKLQLDTNLNWESGDIYGDQTVDIYLDLQTNQMYTMMGELDDNIIEQYNPSSSQNDLYLDPNINNNNNIYNNNYNNNKFKNIYKSTSNNNSNNKLHQPQPQIQQPPQQQKHDDNGDEKKEQKDETQKDEEFENRKQQKKEEVSADSFQDSIKDNRDKQEVNYVIDANDDSGENIEIVVKDEELNNDDKGKIFKMSLSAPESEYDEDEGGSMVKTCTSTGGATSVAEEVASSSIASFNVGNTIRPFIRIILIVKPMRQPHQIRGPYYSRLCMLYPFPLYDALQHATFNTSLYACSRRAMQILQASKSYFTQELVRRLQNVDNFSEVNEQNLEDFFFDPDEFNKVPDDARKIQQALDVIRDEIVTLRQQWNATSWTMTAIEWDRQRTMQAYSFGGRPMTLNVSKTGQSRAASVYNLSLSNNDDDSSVNRKRLSTNSRISSDTVSQIEILRDVMFHAPDRAWNHINFLGIPIPTNNEVNNNNNNNNNNNANISNNNSKDKKKKQNDKQNTTQSYSRSIPPVLAAYLASSPVIVAPKINRSSSISTVSSISSNASGISVLPARKRSAGHRLMRTFGFGGNRNNNGESSDLLNIANNNQSKSSLENSKKLVSKTKKMKELQIDEENNLDDDDTITITIPAPSNSSHQLNPIIPSFTLESTEIKAETMEIRSNKVEENESSSNLEQKEDKNVDVIISREILDNAGKENLSNIDKIESINEYIEVNKHIIENENEILEPQLISTVDSGFQNLIDIIESKSKSQVESETSITSFIEENNNNNIENNNGTTTVNEVLELNIMMEKEGDTNVNSTSEESPLDKNEDKDEIVKENDTFNDDVNYKENIDLEKIDDTNTINVTIDENIESLNVSNKKLTIVSEDSMNNPLAASNSTSTCTSTTHTTTTSATDTPLSSRDSSSPSTPHPNPPPSTPTNGLVLAQPSLSNASFSSSVPSTPHFPPPLFSQSIPQTPSTPYFPAEFTLSLSPETSRPETPEFPHNLSYQLSSPPTLQLVPQSLSEIDTSGPQAPLSSPSSETPLHVSISSLPSTPQFSPSAQNSRPSTPQLKSPTLFEELKQATLNEAQYATTLYEELINVQKTNSSSPLQISPPISPSSLPPLPLSVPSTPQSTPHFSVSVQSSLPFKEKSLTTPVISTNNLSRITTSPLVSPVSKTPTSPISKQAVVTSNTNSPILKSPSASLNSPMISRPPLTRSKSASGRPTPPPLPIPSSARPPPLPLPPTWPTLKKTKKPEPKKDEEASADLLTLRRRTRSRAASLSEGSSLESKRKQDSKYPHGLYEYNEHIGLEQQKIINDNCIGSKIVSSGNVSKPQTNGTFKNLYFEKSYIESKTKNNEFLMDIKSTSLTKDELVATNEVKELNVNSLVNGIANRLESRIITHQNNDGSERSDADYLRYLQFS
ncbi:hypothetical protein RclHR1_00310006 [Rhizophagus clarus]|uniref:Uncharacterized protein n=1 Tax=Rhizophagus clarus TaxID=94130 RepID=A0A2Z6S1A8_9GLOM|nr:hypothetical protein RclHR1_00310006 [Rhizophagus clarus]GES76695.1 hypothetical protein GLOIN_2v1563323 [Rhizophagus clarus]